MNENYKIIDLGFSVADAEDISFGYESGDLLLSFTDWQDNKITVKFENALGFKYQDAEYYNSESERYDSCHIVENSEWLQLHENQSMTWENETWNQYKLNFNAGGVVEVLCSNIILINQIS